MHHEHDEWEPRPWGSFDLYAMGLRAPRCNGCDYARLKHELGDRFLSRNEGGWVAVYELDAEPAPGQSETHEREGRPIRHKASFMSVGHSDECYGWKPPSSKPARKAPVRFAKKPGLLARLLGLFRRKPRLQTWTTKTGQCVLVEEMKPKHLINTYKMVGRNLRTKAAERAWKMLWDEMMRRGFRRRGKIWVDGDGQPVAGRVRMGMVRRGR